MPYNSPSLSIGRVFQSTLPVAGERCHIILLPGELDKAFQSTLPVAGERCAALCQQSHTTSRFQSTLPVAGERCHGRRFRRFRQVGRFNPRSPLPGSDALLTMIRDASLAVSIHAPRCRGAMRRLWAWRLWAWSFQSTLPVAGERCGGFGRGACGLGRFNPRSPLPGSDAPSGIIQQRRLPCFNPRSPLPGSDARWTTSWASWSVGFQSTLAVAGERCCAGSRVGRQS